MMYVQMKHDKPVRANTKNEPQAMNAPFGNKPDFDFKVSLVDETIRKIVMHGTIDPEKNKLKFLDVRSSLIICETPQRTQQTKKKTSFTVT